MAPTLFKMHGTGNSFLIADLTEPEHLSAFKKWQAGLSLPEVTRKLCHPNFSLGADGMVFLLKKSPPQVTWDFFNRDGTAAGLCGNAARCVTLYLNKKYGWTDCEIITPKVRVTGRIQGPESILIGMPPVTGEIRSLPMKIPSQTLMVEHINTGVPHAVVEQKDISDHAALRPLAQFIRWCPELQPEGANVTFYSIASPNLLKSVSFERGVEDFTLSCGTGAVAAALCYAKKSGFSKKQIQIEVPGGMLRVLPSDPPQLEGPAELVAEIQLLV